MGDEMANQADDAIRRANALMDDSGSTNIERTWEALRQAHELAPPSDELPGFPYWVLSKVSVDNIALMLRVRYGAGFHYFEKNGPVIYRSFNIESWRVILFFGNLHQSLTKAMTPIAKHRERSASARSVSFDSFYRDVKQIRNSRRSSGRCQSRSPENELEFLPQDFKTYFNIIQGLQSPLGLQGDFQSEFEPNGGNSQRRNRQSSRRGIDRTATRVRTRARTRARDQTSPRATSEEINVVITVPSDSEDSIPSHIGDRVERDGSANFGHSDLSNIAADAESAQQRDDDLVLSDDPEVVLDHDPAPLTASRHPDPTPDVHNHVDEATNVLLPAESILPSSRPLMEIETLHLPEDGNGASSSGTRQAAENQGRERGEPRSPQSRTGLHIEPTATTDAAVNASDTSACGNQDGEQYPDRLESFGRFIAAAQESFHAKHAFRSSLQAKATALHQERWVVLNRIEQLREECDTLRQHFSRSFHLHLDGGSETVATELPGMYSTMGHDIGHALGNLHDWEESLAVLEAERAKINAAIAQEMATPADTHAHLPGGLITPPSTS